MNITAQMHMIPSVKSVQFASPRLSRLSSRAWRQRSRYGSGATFSGIYNDKYRLQDIPETTDHPEKNVVADQADNVAEDIISTSTIPPVTLEAHGDSQSGHADSQSGDENSHTQDWSNVDPIAWVILLSISVECLIEGIAYALVLRGEFGGAVAILAAMLAKLIPQKLGYAAILIRAGMTHFWENVLSLIAVSSIYLGTKLIKIYLYFIVIFLTNFTIN